MTLLTLRSSLPTTGSLSAFLATGGLFVLLSILSPSTKQGSEVEASGFASEGLCSKTDTPQKSMEVWKIFFDDYQSSF